MLVVTIKVILRAKSPGIFWDQNREREREREETMAYDGLSLAIAVCMLFCHSLYDKIMPMYLAVSFPDSPSCVTSLLVELV